MSGRFEFCPRRCEQWLSRCFLSSASSRPNHRRQGTPTLVFCDTEGTQAGQLFGEPELARPEKSCNRPAAWGICRWVCASAMCHFACNGGWLVSKPPSAVLAVFLRGTSGCEQSPVSRCPRGGGPLPCRVALCSPRGQPKLVQAFLGARASRPRRLTVTPPSPTRQRLPRRASSRLELSYSTVQYSTVPPGNSTC